MDFYVDTDMRFRQELCADETLHEADDIVSGEVWY